MTGAVVRRLGVLGFALAAAGLAGCSNFANLPSLSSLNPMNLFAADKPKPAELEPITPKIGARQAWTARVNSVAFPLGIAVNGNAFTVAGTDGTVLALDANDGHELWRASAGERLSAGVGSDGKYAAVVTRDNELVVMDASGVKWRQNLGGRVATPPLVAGERVFTMGVDRVVNAFDVINGQRIWTLSRPGDALTLSQPGVLAPFKDTLLVGQGARLTGIDPLRGQVRWEVALASPRGTNEVERLADLVGPLARSGDVVCARAFQSSVACANAERATLAWTKVVGGVNAVAGDEQLVFGGDASDRLTAWRAANGDVAWTNERFLNRGLSGPAVLGGSVVFGDSQGLVHFLSRENGETQARLPTDGSAVVGSPARAGNTLLVATANGGLFAFRLQ